MARKATRKKSSPASATAPPRGTSDRDKAIDALMGLLTEHAFEEIDLAEIAGRRRLVKLSDLRAEFRLDAGDLRRSYQGYRPAGPCSTAATRTWLEEPPRERLFDVMMRRLEAMAPYKDGSAFDDALGETQSAAWPGAQRHGRPLASNGCWKLPILPRPVPRARCGRKARALMFAPVLRTWFHDDDRRDSRDRAMAAFNRGLASAERWDGFLGDLCRVPAASAWSGAAAPPPAARYADDEERA